MKRIIIIVILLLLVSCEKVMAARGESRLSAGDTQQKQQEKETETKTEEKESQKENQKEGSSEVKKEEKKNESSDEKEKTKEKDDDKDKDKDGDKYNDKPPEVNIGWKNYPVTLGITLRDAVDDDGILSKEGKQLVVVSVAGVNLQVGREHKIEVRLLDEVTGGVIQYSGKEAKAELTVTPKVMAEVYEFKIPLSGAEQMGKTIAAEATVYLDGEKVASLVSGNLVGGVIEVEGLGMSTADKDEAERDSDSATAMDGESAADADMAMDGEPAADADMAMDDEQATDAAMATDGEPAADAAGGATTGMDIDAYYEKEKVETIEVPGEYIPALEEDPEGISALEEESSLEPVLEAEEANEGNGRTDKRVRRALLIMSVAMTLLLLSLIRRKASYMQ